MPLLYYTVLTYRTISANLIDSEGVYGRVGCVLPPKSRAMPTRDASFLSGEETLFIVLGL